MSVALNQNKQKLHLTLNLLKNNQLYTFLIYSLNKKAYDLTLMNLQMERLR